jgi:tetratricopeptide (TPR) repeat protein/tRNA A-37 threonylcarbamoyl transferase component Bud32
MIGETISHYKITEKLGRGGMGVVYKAIDTKLDRSVALKFIPPELTSDPQAKQRFVHEAKAASALQHNNICTIHEINETDDGCMFIAMDYYEGETLKQKIEDGPIPVEEAIDIIIQVAEGLSKAHEANMIHRDMKPANLIVTSDGVVKIVDFGLAKLVGQTRLTKTGLTVGTAAYMSPEQARGEEVDHRTDIWSLGVIAYEMLTGQLPFRGDHEPAVAYQIVNENPEPITASRSEISMDLEQIINKCLEKNPADRCQNASELITDLSLGKATVTSKPRTNLFKFISVAIAVVVLTAVTWILLQQYYPTSRLEDIAVAVVDFRDLEASDNVTMSAGITNLVQVGLVESAPCRVVSPQYLYDLRRRLFGAGRGSIEADQVLEVARKSGATLLLSGQIMSLASNPYVTWQLVDTRNGKSLGARRVDGDNLSTLADQIIAGVLPLIARECKVETPGLLPSVSDLITASSEAYAHYTAGMLASETWKPNDAVREFEQAVKIDSTFALAYYELSSIYDYFREYGLAKSNAEKAWKYRDSLGIKDRLRVEAWREWMNDRIPDAITIYKEMFSRWPDDRKVLKELSWVLWYCWFFDDAVSVARQGLGLYPDEWVLLNNYVLSNLMLSRMSEAIEASKTYAEQHPDDAEAWLGLAKCYLETGLPDSAETALRYAFKIEHNYYYYHRYMSYCEYYKGNHQRAIDELERLLVRDDLQVGQRVLLITSGWATPSLSFLYAESGRFKKALELFEEAKQLVSDTRSKTNIEYERNRLLLRLGRAEEILFWIQDVARRSDSQSIQVNAASMKVRALVALDSIDAARSAQDQYRLLLDPSSRSSLFSASKIQAEIELAEKDPEAALKTLLEMKRRGMPQRAGWWTIEWREALAHAYYMAGRLEEAAGVHEEMLRIFSGHSLSHYDLGKLYEEMGRATDTASEYEAFIDAWAEADEGLPQIEDAKKRLAVIQKTIQ